MKAAVMEGLKQIFCREVEKPVPAAGRSAAEGARRLDLRLGCFAGAQGPPHVPADFGS